jgi:hypothetical protein
MHVSFLVALYVIRERIFYDGGYLTILQTEWTRKRIEKHYKETKGLVKGLLLRAINNRSAYL